MIYLTMDNGATWTDFFSAIKKIEKIQPIITHIVIGFFAGVGLCYSRYNSFTNCVDLYVVRVV